jgi:hypothetical protein
VLYDITLTGQCRLSEGRKQSLTELTAVPSCYRLYSSVPSVNILLSRPPCSFSQHSALQSALFLQSTFRSPVRSVPSVNIPLSRPLCSFSQHSALQSALFLQSTFHSPVRSVTSYQTDDAVTVTFLQTSTFFSTPKPHSYFAGLSLRWPLVDAHSLHVGTVVQQQQYQLSAANRPQFFITFWPSFAIFMRF